MTGHGRDQPLPEHPTRRACTACSRRRGHDLDPWCHHLPEVLVCHRHRRWLGTEGDSAEHCQPDLSRHPDVLAASRRHRRLTHRHGRDTVLACFQQASEICATWHQRFQHDEDFYRLIAVFHPDGRNVPTTHPTVHASTYPQRVALTRLLVDPHWQSEIRLTWRAPTAFVQQVRRTVAPAYRWLLTSNERDRDPLVHALADRYGAGASPPVS